MTQGLRTATTIMKHIHLEGIIPLIMWTLANKMSYVIKLKIFLTYSNIHPLALTIYPLEGYRGDGADPS